MTMVLSKQSSQRDNSMCFCLLSALSFSFLSLLCFTNLVAQPVSFSLLFIQPRGLLLTTHHTTQARLLLCTRQFFAVWVEEREAVVTPPTASGPPTPLSAFTVNHINRSALRGNLI